MWLTMYEPCSGVDMNILVMMGHFMLYSKAVITSSKTAKVTVTAFWNKFIANHCFPEK